ncbi:hypothetical protein Lal_00036163 [Lupinus albus]|nr:hypothetical protein Lal_00036163 [Lupinus albus]
MEEENHPQTTTLPTFLKQDSSMLPHAVHKSLHLLRRSRRLWRRHGIRELIKEEEVMTVKEENNDKGCVVKEEEEEEEEEVENKINALKKIVPNGESLGMDKLFDETAGYIMALQSQVKALKTLASFFENLEKDKTKLGG